MLDNVENIADIPGFGAYCFFELRISHVFPQTIYFFRQKTRNLRNLEELTCVT